MAELDSSGKYDQYYEEALGDHINMDPGMRDRLQRAQRSIAFSTILDRFPYSIHPMSAPKVVGLLGVHGHDLKESINVARNWQALKDVDFTQKNLVVVTNDSLLALAALAYEQAGIFTPDSNPHRYLSEMYDSERLKHVTDRITTTRTLLGESPLADFILDPVKREIRKKGSTKESNNGTQPTQSNEQKDEPDADLIPGLNATYFTPKRRELLTNVRLSDLMNAITSEAQRGFTHRDKTQIPAHLRWVLMYLANIKEYDQAQTTNRTAIPYSLGDTLPAPTTYELAEALQKVIQRKITEAESAGKTVPESARNPELLKIVDGTINKRRKSGKAV